MQKFYELDIPSVVVISGARRLKEKKVISKKEEFKNGKIYKFKKLLPLDLPSVVVISGARRLKEKWVI